MNKSGGSNDINHVLVEAKLEYTKQLVNFLYGPIFNILEDVYKSAKKKALENGGESMILKSFQTELKNIRAWNQHLIEELYQRVAHDAGCDWLDELLTAVFFSHAKILTSVRIDDREKARIDLKIPTINIFIHRCLIECARQFYSNPYLFYDGLPILDMNRNRRDSLTIIKDCIQETIHRSLPVKNIIQEYLGNSPSAGKQSSSNQSQVSARSNATAPAPSSSSSKLPLSSSKKPSKHGGSDDMSSVISVKDKNELKKIIHKYKMLQQSDDTISLTSINDVISERDNSTVVSESTLADSIFSKKKKHSSRHKSRRHKRHHSDSESEDSDESEDTDRSDSDDDTETDSQSGSGSEESDETDRSDSENSDDTGSESESEDESDHRSSHTSSSNHTSTTHKTNNDSKPFPNKLSNIIDTISNLSLRSNSKQPQQPPAQSRSSDSQSNVSKSRSKIGGAVAGKESVVTPSEAYERSFEEMHKAIAELDNQLVPNDNDPDMVDDDVSVNSSVSNAHLRNSKYMSKITSGAYPFNTNSALQPNALAKHNQTSLLQPAPKIPVAVPQNGGGVELDLRSNVSASKKNKPASVVSDKTLNNILNNMSNGNSNGNGNSKQQIIQTPAPSDNRGDNRHIQIGSSQNDNRPNIKEVTIVQAAKKNNTSGNYQSWDNNDPIAPVRNPKYLFADAAENDD